MSILSISILLPKVNSGVNRNDACPCGSGVKVKKCCDILITSHTQESPLKLHLREKFRMVDLTCHSIEQLNVFSDNKTPSYHKACGKKSLYWRSRNLKTGEQNEKIIRFRCKSWRCEVCRQNLAQVEYQKIKRVVSSSENWVAMLVTFDPKTISRDEAEDLEGEIWNKFRACLKRKIGNFEFYWAREWQKNGMLHKHLIIHSEELYRICGGVYDEEDQKRGIASGEGEYFNFKEGWFEGKLKKYGYGTFSGLQRVREKEGVVKYIVGELTKSYQKRGDYKRGLRLHGHSRGFYKEIREDLKKEKEKKHETIDLCLVEGEIDELDRYISENFKVVERKDEILYKMDENGKVEADSVRLRDFQVIDPTRGP